MYDVRSGKRFETYHHPLELAVVRELSASRYVSQGMSSSWRSD
jgi:hypothetical protein